MDIVIAVCTTITEVIIIILGYISKLTTRTVTVSNK